MKLPQSIEDIDIWLSSIDSNDSQNRQNALKEVLYDSHWIFTILKQAYNPELFSKIGVRKHSLGFYSIALAISNKKDLPSFRVNIYLKQDFKATVETIHSHAYDFSSVILAGSMKQRIYKDQHNHSCNYKKFSFNGKQERYVANVNISKKFEIEMSENSIYSISSDTIHSVNPSSDIMISSLIRSPYNRESTARYVSNNQLDDFDIYQSKVNLDEFKQLISRTEKLVLV